VPELPEVETIVADLRPHLVGRTIVRCELSFPTIVRHPEPEDFIDEITGMRIESVGRRGKYILVHLTGEVVLVVHLGMTGQLRLFDPVTPLEKHTHAVFFLDDGRQLRYRDPRRFGRLLLGTERGLLAAKKMPRLGPEPIDPDFAADELYRRLRKRRTALKAVLLDQSTIARGCAPIASPAPSARNRRDACTNRCARRCKPRSTIEAARSTPIATRGARWAASRNSSWCTDAPASLASHVDVR
jgi:formamidopyrimidine-DNA glycosylase